MAPSLPILQVVVTMQQNQQTASHKSYTHTSLGKVQI